MELIDDTMEAQRSELVRHLQNSGILHNSEVIRAMLKVPREEFLPTDLKLRAYLDTPLPLDESQTISAPHMVAMMCEYLELKRGFNVLEVGGGSGYHAAVVAEIISPTGASVNGHVYTVEIRSSLVEFARRNIEYTGYADRVTVIQGDGSQGLPEHAPYDRVLVTAAAPRIPPALAEQLASSGVMVIPLGGAYSMQELVVARKDVHGDLKIKTVCGVAFVPLIGSHGWREGTNNSK